MGPFSFCESVTATSRSPWCLRRLTASGTKFGGGIDTPSLCGRVEPPWGWDLPVPVSLKHPSACKACLAKLAAEPEGGER